MKLLPKITSSSGVAAFAIALSSLSGCKMLVANHADWCVTDTGKYVECGDLHIEHAAIMPSLEPQPKHPLSSSMNHKSLNEYVEQMALHMSDRIDPYHVSPIAVTSFVTFDSTLNRTNMLGNQIAESFISELQNFGMPVVDFKTTGAISVTPVGDFSFSRNFEALSDVQQIGYVLSGTMVQKPEGVLVHARIVGVKSKVVLAATSQLIPQFIIERY